MVSGVTAAKVIIVLSIRWRRWSNINTETSTLDGREGASGGSYNAWNFALVTPNQMVKQPRRKVRGFTNQLVACATNDSACLVRCHYFIQARRLADKSADHPICFHERIVSSHHHQIIE